MDRLTEKSIYNKGHYTLTCLDDDVVFIPGDICAHYCFDQAACECCGIQKAFNRLAAYEDTGLTPEEVTAMKAEYSDTQQLCDIKDTRIAILEALCESLENTCKEYRALDVSEGGNGNECE